MWVKAPDRHTYSTNNSGTPRDIRMTSGPSSRSMEKATSMASTRNRPCRKGFRDCPLRCGNSELVTSGQATRSRGATANVLGRSSRRHVPVGAPLSAPQLPQNTAAGTAARQAGHSRANSSSACTDIAV